MTDDPDEHRALARAIVDEVERRRSIDPATHRRHHVAIERWLAREERKQALFERVKGNVASYLAIGTVAAVTGWLTGLWAWLVRLFRGG